MPNNNLEYLQGTTITQENGVWAVRLQNTGTLGYNPDNPVIYGEGGLATQMPATVGAQASSSWDVPTINALGSVATAIGNAVMGFNASKTNKIVAQYQAQIQDNNARMAELSALSALNQSQWKIAALTMRAGKVKSSQKVAMAANGIRVGRGSSAELLATTELMKRIDVNTEYANGYRAAWGYRLNAIQAGMKASALRGTVRGASPMAAGASYLTAGILDTYKNYAKETK